jgi:hypothetical protein
MGAKFTSAGVMPASFLAVPASTAGVVPASGLSVVPASLELVPELQAIGPATSNAATRANHVPAIFRIDEPRWAPHVIGYPSSNAATRGPVCIKRHPPVWTTLRLHCTSR